MSVSDVFKKIVGIQDETGYEEYEESNELEDQEGTQSVSTQYFVPVDPRERNTPVKSRENMSNKVVGMPGVNNANAEVMVIEPKTFDEMPKVINALRERKSVVLNLATMDPHEAQRAVDFVAGGTYAMDGHNERVGDNIFLFTPSCVTVSSLSGLVSGADDLTTARSTLNSIRRPLSHSVSPWDESTAVAQ